MSFNPYHRKPKPETMKKNREIARTQYKEEMEWLMANLPKLNQYGNKFLVEMYTIMVSGGRKLTPKMVSSIQNGIERCKKNPNYNEDLRWEANERMKPTFAKINIVLSMAEAKNDKGVYLIKSIDEYAKKNYRISKKQMEVLNKIYKRVSDNLFDKDE